MGLGRWVSMDQIPLDILDRTKCFARVLRRKILRGRAMVSLFLKDHRPYDLLEFSGDLGESRDTNVHVFVGCECPSYY